MSPNGRDPGLHVRTLLVPRDYPGLSAANQAARIGAGRPSSITLADLTRYFEHLVNCDPLHDIVVAKRDGRICGYGVVFWRDLVEGGRLVVGHVEMEPTWLSKINTALEFTALAGLLAHAAALIDGSDWLQPLFVLVCLTVTLSGTQYVWIWSRKAAAARRAQRGGGAFSGGG